MKRVLLLFTALILCLSLCACGNDDSAETMETETLALTPVEEPVAEDAEVIEEVTEAKNPDEIELTLDNYSKYLKIHGRMTNPRLTDGVYIGSVSHDTGTTFYLYRHFEHVAEVAGVSTNFNYNDVVVTLRFTGSYKNVNIKTDEWDDGHEIDVEVTIECNIAGDGGYYGKFEGNGAYMLRDMAEVKWEVVAISGTVTPA